MEKAGGKPRGAQELNVFPGNGKLTSKDEELAGNSDWAIASYMGNNGSGTGVVREKRSRSFYGADQRLRYFQERDVRVSGLGGQQEGVWEEYRYDPLGRRVLVNTRRKDLCNSGGEFRCAAATTRMVWAGDQLLWEIRQSSQSPGEDPAPSGSFGVVSYTHAGGIDRPLVITKGSTSILPHQNWRGQFSSGTYASGARSDCLNGATTSCHPVPWPGWRTTAWHEASKEQDIQTWWGGLVDGMRDASGQMYMRNRYYDPATGQFTQPDPIGIAGGLNSYGFAAGDPVSYADPYGLSAEECCPNDANPRQIELEVQRAQNATPGQALFAGSLLLGGSAIALAPRALPALGAGARRLWNRMRSSADDGFASAARINTLDDVVANPSVLQGKAPGQIMDAIESSPNWIRGTMRRSKSRPDEGVTFRQTNSAGNDTGRYIQWHPGGGHHGPHPYWKVSSGERGVVRVDAYRGN